MKLPPLPLVVLDTETTGFVPRVHRVIEFASVTVREGKIMEEYEQLFHAKEVPPHVEVLTSIHTKDLVGQPSFEEKRDEVLAHIPDDALIVGQNVLFDIGMLKGEGIDLSERPWIDTSMLTSLVFPELESYSLGYLSTVLDLTHENQHRAMGDVQATLALLAKVWERLLGVPSPLLTEAKSIMERGSAGYRLLFSALPASRKKTAPAWLARPSTSASKMKTPSGSFALTTPQKGSVSLQDEPLGPSFLQTVLESAARSKQPTWIAVKNIEHALSRLSIPSDETFRILYPGFLRIDHAAAKTFLKQETFSADEATLAVKLAWYKPSLRADFPLHGGEEAVWNGKLACTETSALYSEQFSDLPATALIDHRQLLHILSTPEHSGNTALTGDTHIVIDDASMLEDTATKAWGWRTALDDLRAAAEGDATLTKLADLVQLWSEKTRQFQDTHYLAKADLSTPEAKGLREQLRELALAPPPAVAKILDDLAKIIDPLNLQNRIVWIETRQNGSQILHSVPENIAAFLHEYLYSRFPTTLLIPAFSGDSLPEILPPQSSRAKQAFAAPADGACTISLSREPSLEAILTSPPPGKSIVLLPGKSAIEDLFVKYKEQLEAAGTTMICQGMSGGQGRMQAEFLAASAPVIWLVTPWVFEGLDLPPCVDHLFIRTLPFDHPSHPVFSRRSQRYRNGFTEYCLPRLLHRLFRILRTFCRIKTSSGTAVMQDERLWTKEYGKKVQGYLANFSAEESKDLLQKSADPPKKKRTKKKKGENQMSLF